MNVITSKRITQYNMRNRLTLIFYGFNKICVVKVACKQVNTRTSVYVATWVIILLDLWVSFVSGPWVLATEIKSIAWRLRETYNSTKLVPLINVTSLKTKSKVLKDCQQNFVAKYIWNFNKWYNRPNINIIMGKLLLLS